MSYTVLARKWRPKNFSELVGQAHVMQALSNALDSNRLHHAYLFTGTRGVGKTTIARIFSKALNCQEGISSTPCGVCDTCRAIDEGRFIDLIEVDAASRTKVDDTREILDNVQFAPTQGRYKVYLIDEVHMLSKSSFNALLKTLEEPPEHVKFLLATTDPHKLPATVLSRCLQFNLMRLTQPQIQAHLANILEKETIPFEQSALALIAKSADGSARDALSLLDQAIAYGAGEIRFEQVQTMLGLVDQHYTVAILQALAEESPSQIKELVQQLAVMGVDYPALLAQLIETLHTLAYNQVLGGSTDSSLLPEEVIDELSHQLSADRVQLLYQIALLSKQDMQLAPDIRIGFEMALMRMLAFQPATTVTGPDKSADSAPLKEAADGGRLSASGLAQTVSQASPTPATASADPMLTEQDPQVVLSALSSARALVSKNRPAVKESLATQDQFESSPATELPQQSQHAQQEQQPQDQQTYQPAEQMAVDDPQSSYGEPSYYSDNPPVIEDAPPWDLDGSDQMSGYQQHSMQNQQASQAEPAAHIQQHEQPPSSQPIQQQTEESTAVANDHLSQIKARLKQPLGKPAGTAVSATNTPSFNAHLVSEPPRSSELNSESGSELNVVPNPVAVASSSNSPSLDSAQQNRAENSVRNRLQQVADCSESSTSEPNNREVASGLNDFEPPQGSKVDGSVGSGATISDPVILSSAQAPEGVTTMESAVDIEYLELSEQNRLTVWLSVLTHLKPEGMAAELTRQSVLVAYSPQVWQLSVDPEQAYAKTDMAVLRLTETIERRLGHSITLEFIEFNQHNTPAKHEQFLADEKQSQAEMSIESDPMIRRFMSELGMQLVPNSVTPASE